jgi:hypothetical protein
MDPRKLLEPFRNPALRTQGLLWAAQVGFATMFAKFASLGPSMPEMTGEIPAYIQGGHRSPESLRFVVLHSTESQSGALNIANYFSSPSAGGSTQLVVGEDGIYRCVPDLVQPAGAPGANEDGLHIEMVGYAAWSRDEWLSRGTTIRNAAVCVAAWCALYDIPTTMLLEPSLLREPSARGITTHACVSLAFRKSDHMDPGPNFPFDVLAQELLWLRP